MCLRKNTLRKVLTSMTDWTREEDEALRLAWDALQQIAHVSAMDYEYQQWAVEAITAIKEALAQPEQEPMTKAGELRAMKTELWKQREQDGKCKYCTDGCPACDARKLPEQDWIERERAVGYREGHRAALAQRTWVGLDEEDYIKAYELCDFDKNAAFEFFEAKLRSKNNG
jgi:hypothetical protein